MRWKRSAIGVLPIVFLLAACPDPQMPGPQGNYTVSLTSPRDGLQLFVSHAAPMLSFSAETSSDGRTVSVTFYVDGEEVLRRTRAPFAGSAAYAMSPGIRTVRAVAVRDDGTEAEDSVQVFVDASSVVEDSDGDGVPDAPFEVLTEPGDTWFSESEAREVFVTALSNRGRVASKALETFVVSHSRTPHIQCAVTVDIDLVGANESTILVLTTAPSLPGMLSMDEDELRPTLPGFQAPEAIFVEIDIISLSADGRSYESIDSARLAERPIRIAMSGFRTLPLNSSFYTFNGEGLSNQTETVWSVNGIETESITGLNMRGRATTLALFGAFSGSATDIGDLGGVNTFALGVNDAGAVVGYSYLFVSANERRGFFYTTGDGMTEIGTLGAKSSFAFAVNAFSEVAGYDEDDDETGGGFVWTSGGGLTSLGNLGGNVTQAFDINDGGTIVGYSTNAGGDTRAFQWTSGGGISDLGTLGGDNSVALGINDLDQIVGESQTAGGEYHAFSWTLGGGMVDLGTLGGTGSIARDVNEFGFVVGAAETGGGATHAFIWSSGGGMVDMGTLGGASSEALALNDSNVVVGTSLDSMGEVAAFSWTSGGGFVDLNDLLAPGSQDRLERAWDINSSGVIVGEGSSGNSTRGFLVQ